MTKAHAAVARPPSWPLRYWDERLGAWSVSVLAGEVYVTDRDESLTTVLGSCVSACVRHPETGAGGMNHLVLAEAPGAAPTSPGGLASLDLLVSRVLRFGGELGELEVKVFGGGRVIAAGSDVGAQNIAAVRAYFAERGLRVAIADIGGGVARRLRFEPRTGRVLIRRMVMRDTGEIEPW